MKEILVYQLKRNRKYILLSIVFMIWLIFFDSRNYFVQKKLDDQIEQLETEFSLYEQKLVQVKEQFEDVKNNPEKYAREKYYMHKKGEVVFIYNQ